MRTFDNDTARGSAILAVLALCAGAVACGLDDAEQPTGGPATGKADGLPLVWSPGCIGVSFPFKYSKPCVSAPVYRCGAADGGQLACAAADYVRQGVDAITYGTADGLRTVSAEQAFLDGFSGGLLAWRGDASWAASCTVNAKLESFGLIDAANDLPGDRRAFSAALGSASAALAAVDARCGAWVVVMGSDNKAEGFACADAFTGDNARCAAAAPPPSTEPADGAADQGQSDGPTTEMPSLAFSEVVDGVVVGGYKTSCSSAKVIVTKLSSTSGTVAAKGTWEEENIYGQVIWTSAGNPSFSSCNHVVGGPNDESQWHCEIAGVTNGYPRKIKFVLELSPGTRHRYAVDLGCW